jgi:BMFP domain-containing protein YqiC
MFNRKLIQGMLQIIRDLPEELDVLKVNLQRNYSAILESVCSDLKLVTRHDFDVQKEVLMRVTEQVERLNIIVSQLEKQFESF